MRRILLAGLLTLTSCATPRMKQDMAMDVLMFALVVMTAQAVNNSGYPPAGGGRPATDDARGRTEGPPPGVIRDGASEDADSPFPVVPPAPLDSDFTPVADSVAPPVDR